MSDVNDFVETAVNRTAVRDLEYPPGHIASDCRLERFPHGRGSDLPPVVSNHNQGRLSLIHI